MSRLPIHDFRIRENYDPWVSGYSTLLIPAGPTYTLTASCTLTRPYDQEPLPAPFVRDESGIEWETEISPGEINFWQHPTAPVKGWEEKMHIHLRARCSNSQAQQAYRNLKRGWLDLTSALSPTEAGA